MLYKIPEEMLDTLVKMSETLCIVSYTLVQNM